METHQPTQVTTIVDKQTFLFFWNRPPELVPNVDRPLIDHFDPKYNVSYGHYGSLWTIHTRIWANSLHPVMNGAAARTIEAISPKASSLLKRVKQNHCFSSDINLWPRIAQGNNQLACWMAEVIYTTLFANQTGHKERKRNETYRFGLNRLVDGLQWCSHTRSHIDAVLVVV